jgi:hypothetical protein
MLVSALGLERFLGLGSTTDAVVVADDDDDEPDDIFHAR